MHCLSTKSGSWDQFGSSLATAFICLTGGRRFNWSNYIFKGMVNNITNPKKFLMFPRFLQIILNIETRNTKLYHAFKLTSKMFANMRLNFHGDHMPLLATMLPPAQPAIAGESLGEAEPSNPQTGPSSDPNPASSSQPPASEPEQFTSTHVEDDTMGGSFDISPPRTTQTPPEGTTSGGDEDPDKLTALSSLVDSLMQKVDTQASDLKAHKLMFKEVVGKLVKKVKAAATTTVDSDVPTGGSHEDAIPPSSNIPSGEFASGSDVPAGATPGYSADPFNKVKSPLIEEDPPVKERSFRQREEDRLGEEDARRMYEAEKAELEREREELQRKRQQDVLNSAKYYTDTDWNDIMGQVHANQGLTADLLGPDVTEDNFAERMVALIAKRRREFDAQRFQDKLNKPMTVAQQKAYMRTFVKNQSSTIYTTGWTMKHVKSLSDAQLKTEFDKIRTTAADLQSQNLRRSLKRPGADLKHASSKKSKSTEAPKPDVPADSQQPSVEKVGTRRKRFGRKGVHPSRSTIPIKDGDPEAEHKMCIKYASDADSASDDDTPVTLHGVVDWELLSTGLGWVNVIYRKDNSRKCFSRLREILHLVTRTDLMIIYGRVMTFYQEKEATGVGLVLWGDLKLYSSTGIHVFETVSGLVLHMFVDKRYPLSVNLIELMLDHQLEICRDIVGNELTTAVQLIAFLKKQISDSIRPKVHDCCGDPVAVHVSMLRFLLLLQSSDVCFWRWFQDVVVQSSVPAGSVVPTGKDSSIVSTGSTKVIPAGSKILVLVLGRPDMFEHSTFLEGPGESLRGVEGPAEEIGLVETPRETTSRQTRSSFH
ncbi:hypothetical protein Tco_1540298 [Tanacetum coccineum]